MSELGQHGAYLKDSAIQVVTHVVRLYSAALDTAYPDLKLSHESLSKKEAELLAVMTIATAMTGGISFRDFVTEFVAVASEMYREDEGAPF